MFFLNYEKPKITEGIIKLLVVDPEESNYNKIKQYIKQRFNLPSQFQWISQFERDFPINNQNYDIYLCNLKLGKIEDFLEQIKILPYNLEFRTFMIFIYDNISEKDKKKFYFIRDKNRRIIYLYYLKEQELEYSSLENILVPIIDKLFWLNYISNRFELITKEMNYFGHVVKRVKESKEQYFKQQRESNKESLKWLE